MNKLLAVAALAMAALSGAAAAPLWSRDGHEITARVAMMMMDEQANATVSSILQGQTLSQVSTWADSYKHTSHGGWSEKLHFVDLTPSFVCTYKPECCGDGCVVSAIQNYTQRVQQETGDDQNVALKFLVHFLGDIHQPMHVANADDRGGNSIRGEFDDGNQHGNTNLHFIWDSGLLLVRRQDFDGQDQDYAEYLYEQTLPSGKYASDAQQWQQCESGSFPCPDEWAAGTAATACKQGYTDSTGKRIENGFSLGGAYYKFNVDTLDRQLAMGGVRLGKLMNQLFGNASRQ